MLGLLKIPVLFYLQLERAGCKLYLCPPPELHPRVTFPLGLAYPAGDERTADASYGGNGTTFFETPSDIEGAAFRIVSPTPLPGIQRNSLNGSGYHDVDVSLSKAFGLPRVQGLGENAKFEIRADVYNFFNKTNINTASIDGNMASVALEGIVTRTPSDCGGTSASFLVPANASFSRARQWRRRHSEVAINVFELYHRHCDANWFFVDTIEKKMINSASRYSSRFEIHFRLPFRPSGTPSSSSGSFGDAAPSHL